MTEAILEALVIGFLNSGTTTFARVAARSNTGNGRASFAACNNSVPVGAEALACLL